MGDKMKKSLLFCAMCLMPSLASAAIPYRTEVSRIPTQPGATDDESFARAHRFYVGGMYNFSVWNDGTDDVTHISGKNTSSFEFVAGVRAFDTFRIEANYIRAAAEWDAFKLTGNTAMVNAIFDARIDSMYRAFHHQLFVPYVGVGGGLSWNHATDVELDKTTSMVAAAMAGVGIEMGEYFTVDLGYRYMYMFAPEFKTMRDYAPIAHQLRAGVRINF